uniref:PPM-type phosphatase domain-containing protein n=1 Tax=Chromera velia CCMP2878 TaxID=1169474 RepID=A0A0G4FRS2_9ALVE|eukprot:Cvel_18339.t1-p1 / transcript=Cvel_18339.t1 / gene=Cvel_18339 / organism=Chromera_velia_CCMP2878 / gene_product=Probable protein phosphatase 2C 35, putative / transcript_product=Probable protein phosphatase 2C 35, putative / location=Cvel_scaffold1514:29008-33860(-) / protein_length=520 / sequence_SO=supercontig / SO=protein_coding / is_pseudo=false
MGVNNSKKGGGDLHDGIKKESGGSSPGGAGGDGDPPKIAAGRRRLSVSHSAAARQDDDSNDKRGMAMVDPDAGENQILSLFRGANRRMSISGAPAVGMQRGFDQKDMERLGDDTKLSDQGLGFVCRKGLKPESPNQDDFFILRIDDWGLYGVFDGHGPFGHDVSHFVQNKIPKLIVTHPQFQEDPKAALTAAFLDCHNQMVAHCAATGAFDCSLSGCTGSVVLHRQKDNKIFTAHVGDSRAVLAYSENGKMKAKDLTIDHKPNSTSEKNRIHKAGGQVRQLEGDIPHRVFLKGKLYPGLAMSRALGDTVGTQAGVTAEPEVNEYSIEQGKDQLVLVCSDGVWEFITSQGAIDLVSKVGQRKAQKAAEALAQEAWMHWIKEEENVVDDITVQLIWLYPTGKKGQTVEEAGTSAAAPVAGGSQGAGGAAVSCPSVPIPPSVEACAPLEAPGVTTTMPPESPLGPVSEEGPPVVVQGWDRGDDQNGNRVGRGGSGSGRGGPIRVKAAKNSRDSTSYKQRGMSD